MICPLDETKIEPIHKFKLSLPQLELANKTEAKIVHNIEELCDDLSNITLPTKARRRSTKETAIQLHKLTEKLFSCIVSGTNEDIVQMEDLLSMSPATYLRDSSDPESFMNKPNLQGIRPIYEATRCGLINVVKFLQSRGADPHFKCEISRGEFENSLDVACRWRYLQIVRWFLANSQWTSSEIRHAYKTTDHIKIREILRDYDPKAISIWKFMCSCCFS